MDFKTLAKTEVINFEKHLNEGLNEWREIAKTQTPMLLPLVDQFIDASKGGKRLRALLVKLGYQLGGGKEIAKIYKPAVAFEIFQTSILAHDDIMDQSPLRRGKETIYKALGGDHYAVSQTICLGDIGFFVATKMIADSDFSAELKNKALSSFIDSMLHTGSGQMMDIEIPKLKSRNLDDVITVFKLKTAYYTLIGPMSLGAILAGADQKLLDQIGEFGKNLGIAFQIQDDILGIFGDQKTIGKSVTSDIEEGKVTLLYLKALEKADQTQRDFLDKYYGKGKIGEQEVEKIREIFTDTKALDYSKSLELEYVSKSKDLIVSLTEDPLMQQILNELADYLVSREK